MEDTGSANADMSDGDDIDLDTLVSMLDEDGMSEPHEEGVSEPHEEGVSEPHEEGMSGSHVETSGASNPSTFAELGLVLSDDEEDQPSSSSKSFPSFSAAFSQSKRQPETKQNVTTEVVEPLEAELRAMEARVKELQERLSKKKRLDPNHSHKFTKLTSTPDQARRVNSRTLSAKEEAKLHKKLRQKSELRTGDTDSEDDEDKRNPMEQTYNACGREIKQRIAHESKTGPRERIEIVPMAKKTSGVERPGWKGTEGALVNIGRAGASTSQEQDKNVTLDAYSGIRIINPKVSQEALREMMEARKMVRMSTITLHLRKGEIEGDWATIAVLVAKGNPKVSQKGSQYCIWKLSDLSDCTKTAALFLFGGAYKALWKHSVGSVLGVLNPNIMKDKQGDGFSDMISLSVFEGQRVMMMGMSKDLGWCKGTTKMKEPCRSFVNKSSCEFCVYHIQREYKKMSSKRAVIQSSFSRVDPKQSLQERVLGKDQVFYGGQLYTSPALSSAPKQPKQARPNRSKDLATLNSLKIKGVAEELKAKDKVKVNIPIPKHFSEGEVSAVKEVMQKNEQLGEKLLAPTPGARHFLKYMVKEDTDKKVAAGTIRHMTAKELLAMTHEGILARKRQQEQMKSGKSATPSVSPSALPALQPQLARGVKPGQMVDLDFSYPSPKQVTQMAKAKAVAMVKRKGGIQAAEPNAVKNKDKAAVPKFKNKVQKRLNTSNDDDDDATNSAGKKSRLTEAVEEGKTRDNLGALDINSDKFKAMMGKKSRHSKLVDVVENEAMDKYYKGLEKKEMLEDKLTSITELSVTAYVCIKCRYMSEKVSDLCKEQNHQLKTVPAKKRFFECKNCKQRTSSLDKLPRKSCGNCDRSSWCRVPMGMIKKGPKLDSEILCLRGDELSHYSASSGQVFLHI